ncbi:hypothetical protein ACJJTC_014412 [Scirpophaga incertulas]
MFFKWLHSFVRSRTKPIPEDIALQWKKRLGIIYGLIAWNAFGFVVYSIYKGKADWAHYYGLKSDEEKATRSGIAWANTLGIKNAKVYRIAGLTKVDDYEIVEGEAIFSSSNSKETREQVE